MLTDREWPSSFDGVGNDLGQVRLTALPYNSSSIARLLARSLAGWRACDQLGILLTHRCLRVSSTAADRVRRSREMSRLQSLFTS